MSFKLVNFRIDEPFTDFFGKERVFETHEKAMNYAKTLVNICPKTYPTILEFDTYQFPLTTTIEPD